MNQVVLMGRLTRDPDVRYSGSEENMLAVGKYSLAVDRRATKNGKQEADFISCVCFGRAAEFAEKYLSKGMKIAVAGRIQTGSYTNRDGNKVYTTDVVVENHYFCESKGSGAENQPSGSGIKKTEPQVDADGFMNIPDGIDEELPFA